MTTGQKTNCGVGRGLRLVSGDGLGNLSDRRAESHKHDAREDEVGRPEPPRAQWKPEQRARGPEPPSLSSKDCEDERGRQRGLGVGRPELPGKHGGSRKAEK